MNDNSRFSKSDLETAKIWFDGCARFKANADGFQGDARRDRLAATCIEFVEELLKCRKPWDERRGYYRRSEVNEDTTYDIQDGTGWEIAEKLLNVEDADHFVELHNLWLKVTSAFERTGDD